jgi:hypothetical protein
VLEPFPRLFLSEVVANNLTGSRDTAGDRDPWIELANLGPAVGLKGYSLGASYGNPTAWAFPGDATLDAGAYRLVWADGEPGESTAAEWHAGFRLSTAGGVVVLARLQGGLPAIVDYLEYGSLGPDQAFGFPDPSQPGAVPVLLPEPTPAAPNTGFNPTAPEITGLSMDPDGSAWVQWASVPGRSYAIERTLDLADPVWESVGELTAVETSSTVMDPGDGLVEQRYYRVVLLP